MPRASIAHFDLGVDHRQATNEISDRPCDLVHIPRRTNRLTGSCSPRPEAEILEVANGCYRKGSATQISRYQGCCRDPKDGREVLRGGHGRLFGRGNSRGNLWLGFEPGVFLENLSGALRKKRRGPEPAPFVGPRWQKVHQPLILMGWNLAPLKLRSCGGSLASEQL
jgi:hypothetical protein